MTVKKNEHSRLLRCSKDRLWSLERGPTLTIQQETKKLSQWKGSLMAQLGSYANLASMIFKYVAITSLYIVWRAG